ncbi:(deoxy)nucleoside triphosphate pyrophosphohydrolase [Microbacterium sp. KUDC0406]|uniref:(deoxy)nucleoside triphosphate pyrophosphohydrolase n=1 Tax=Microbacterium sp. KUDC0406 TaxID=2909588 RepID=UPI001F293D82|nr:(deoxy)nucleoside triphosphate pyrophosphohydrolase [Microbacterium sp. KUDC0406]UJP09388.1 (deoxy)nucleoside triphosphate pyrophosphohydrolase [Microbacterium sp. KUDC0406]
MSEAQGLRKIPVSAAAIIRDGLVLAAQRGRSAALPGLWEFPGGKLEVGETAEDAVRREIHEELGCTVSVGPRVAVTVHTYDFAVVELSTFYATIVDGVPSPREHSRLLWLPPHQLMSLKWTLADMPAVEQVLRDMGA